jgi:hypothetical protein
MDKHYSSLTSYAHNNNANGGPQLDPSTDTDFSDIYDGGLQAAGVINLPVCDGLTAWYNWQLADTSGANYPCTPLSTSKRAVLYLRSAQRRGAHMIRRAYSQLMGRC